MDIYLTEDNLLGLVLLDGTLVRLINTRTITIGTIEQPYHITLSNLFLEPLNAPRTFCEYQVVSSLGEGSISQLSNGDPYHQSWGNKRSMIASISHTSFDYSLNCP